MACNTMESKVKKTDMDGVEILSDNERIAIKIIDSLPVTPPSSDHDIATELYVGPKVVPDLLDLFMEANSKFRGDEKKIREVCQCITKECRRRTQEARQAYISKYGFRGNNIDKPDIIYRMLRNLIRTNKRDIKETVPNDANNNDNASDQSPSLSDNELSDLINAFRGETGITIREESFQTKAQVKGSLNKKNND